MLKLHGFPYVGRWCHGHPSPLRGHHLPFITSRKPKPPNHQLKDMYAEFMQRQIFCLEKGREREPFTQRGWFCSQTLSKHVPLVSWEATCPTALVSEWECLPELSMVLASQRCCVGFLVCFFHLYPIKISPQLLLGLSWRSAICSNKRGKPGRVGLTGEGPVLDFLGDSTDFKSKLGCSLQVPCWFYIPSFA